MADGATGLIGNGRVLDSPLFEALLRYIAFMQRATVSNTYSELKSDNRLYFEVL